MPRRKDVAGIGADRPMTRKPSGPPSRGPHWTCPSLAWLTLSHPSLAPLETETDFCLDAARVQPHAVMVCGSAGRDTVLGSPGQAGCPQRAPGRAAVLIGIR